MLHRYISNATIIISLLINHIYIYIDHGVFTIINKLSCDHVRECDRLVCVQVKRLMLQLLSAVNHMHKHWYIHRDLKTSNLLYSNKGKLAVCDFGMARKYGR